MQTETTSETSLSSYQTTGHNAPEDSNHKNSPRIQVSHKYRTCSLRQGLENRRSIDVSIVHLSPSFGTRIFLFKKGTPEIDKLINIVTKSTLI